VHTEDGAIGLGSVFSNSALVQAALKSSSHSIAEKTPSSPNALPRNFTSTRSGWVVAARSPTPSAASISRSGICSARDRTTDRPSARRPLRERVRPYASILMEEPARLADGCAVFGGAGFARSRSDWGPSARWTRNRRSHRPRRARRGGPRLATDGRCGRE
jgi:hypothetical protein